MQYSNKSVWGHIIERAHRSEEGRRRRAERAAGGVGCNGRTKPYIDFSKNLLNRLDALFPAASEAGSVSEPFRR